MARLVDIKDTVLLNALVTNPSAAYFPWNCSDYPYATYPNGIPRANVLAAYQGKADERIGKGGTFAVLYAPGIVALPFGSAPNNFSAGVNQTETAYPASNVNPALSAPAGGSALLQAAPVVIPAGGGLARGSQQIITQSSQVS